MKGKIYLLDDKDGLRAMNETPYESEKLLQELLAKHPDLLAGDQIDRSEPRRWLLVSREMAVAAEEDGASRWSLDHLFLDQDGVPTLVEVKRSTDTRVRREVVGQMLDYAAHAVHWKIETLQAKFELTCSANGDDPEDLMSAFLDEGLDVDAFWQQVKTNLQAGLLRLVFVADVIPSELLDIIEFLNKQMDPAQAIAVEVRQFVGEDMRTLVPRVLGRTDPSRERVARSAGREPVGREVFWQAFADDRPADEHVVMRQLENWAIERGLEPVYLTGQRGTVFSPKLIHNGNVFHPIAAGRKGTVMLHIHRLVSRTRFRDPSVQEQLYEHLQHIPGLVVTNAGISGFPKIPLASLVDAAEFDRFRSALDWMLEVIRGAPLP